uniref:USP domain-containing protein n=1 Tax=Oryza brachyantha TaxID=4533 RepID=J3M4S2_ORYBR
MAAAACRTQYKAKIQLQQASNAYQGLRKDVGHFVAYVRKGRLQQSNGSSLWFCASDAKIRKISLEVLTCEADLIFYERILKAKSTCKLDGKKLRIGNGMGKGWVGLKWPQPRASPTPTEGSIREAEPAMAWVDAGGYGLEAAGSGGREEARRRNGGGGDK